MDLGTAVLTVGGNNGSTTFSGDISGNGSLVKEGTGTLTLSGASAYSGGTTLSVGKIIVGNSQALGTGDVSLNDGTTLKLGTTALSIGGNFSQAAGSTLALTIAENDYGSIVADGDIDVSGYIDVSLASGYHANDATVDILSAGGTLNFGGLLTLLSDWYTKTESIHDGILSLMLSRTGGFESDTGRDGNTGAVGRVLDNIPNAEGDMLNVLNTLDGMSSGDVESVLSTMMPDISSGSAQGSRMLAGNHLTSISNRLGGMRSGFANSGVSSGETIDGTGVWIQGLGNNMEQETRKGIEGFEANAFSTTIGIDHLINSNVRLGLAGGYGYADVKSKRSGHPTDEINSYNVSLYGSYDSMDLCEARVRGKNRGSAIKDYGEDYWYVDGVLGFTWNEYDSRRETFGRVAKAEHSGQEWSAKTELGYTFTFEPQKRLR